MLTRRIAAEWHNSYLNARSNETVAEQPVVKTEDQGYISYNKAPLALFALQELLGADKINGALRACYARFVDMQPPFPTSRDLIDELREAAGPEHQNLITDLFEKIVLYDVAITAAQVHPVDGGYDVVLDVAGKQFEAGGDGAENEVPLDTWFQVAVFPESERDVIQLQPLYLQHHRLRTGMQQLTVRVAEKPGSIGIDPFHLMIDRTRDDNLLQLKATPLILEGWERREGGSQFLFSKKSSGVFTQPATICTSTTTIHGSGPLGRHANPIRIDLLGARLA